MRMMKKKFKPKSASMLRFRKRKCFCCVNKVSDIDYKELEMLRRFMSDRGKIIPRRITGACAQHQRKIVRSIKKARSITLMPYTAQ